MPTNMNVLGEGFYSVHNYGDVVRVIFLQRELRFLGNGQVWAYERVLIHTFRSDLSGGSLSESTRTFRVQNPLQNSALGPGSHH